MRISTRRYLSARSLLTISLLLLLAGLSGCATHTLLNSDRYEPATTQQQQPESDN